MRAGLEAISGEIEEVRVGEEAMLVPRGAHAAAAAPGQVRMLGNFDTYLLGWKDRAFSVTGEHAIHVKEGGGGWIRPVIVEDGIVVGGWRSSRKGGRLEISLNLPRAERERLGARDRGRDRRHRPLRRRGGHDCHRRVAPRGALAYHAAPMSDEDHQLTTDQSEREASGAHEYGRYLEEFEVGAVYKHWPAKTITESEDHLFCLLTMNHHPLHINDVYASNSQQGRNVVAGPYVYSLMFGMTVNDVSGKAIANLATEDLSHPNPVFHGDTLFVESEVLEVRPSQSKPDRGVVRVHTRAYNQDGTLVAEFKRAVLVPRKTEG